MKHIKHILCGAAFVSLFMPSAAIAATDYHYASAYDVKMNPGAYNLSATTHTRLDQYLDYEHREPCQSYWDPPAGFVKDGCDIYLPLEVQRAAPVRQTVVTQTQSVQQAPAAVVVQQPVAVMPPNMEVNFDFNKSNLTTDATSIIYQAAQKIRDVKPRTVILHGHADTSGPEAYNVGLSQRRADSVYHALTLNGINGAMLQTRAYGESQPKVATGDGVKLRENRRVVIEFVR